ncbi:MAG TPA: cytochrome P460 family protein [Xanthobacteraceae bacterium]
MASEVSSSFRAYVRDLKLTLSICAMKRILLSATTTGVIISLIAAVAIAQQRAAPQASPIFGVNIPDDYRQWELIAPASGERNGIRAILGNAIAINAYRNGTLPFPDGAMLAELIWARVASPDASKALAPEQVFVSGGAMLLQFMVKDSKRYAATGGWGFGRFVDGAPADTERHKTCFPCHAQFTRDHDLVFMRFAP